MNKTPLWASDISPGLAVRPPPMMAAVEAVWWGSRNGRLRLMPPLSIRPASECTIEVSSASAGLSWGKILGNRAASIDFPDPGGPTISKWCRPAAAISIARFARSCPLTSRISRWPFTALICPGRAGSMGRIPLRCWISTRKFLAPITFVPSTHAASAPQVSGQKSDFPNSAALCAAGRAPLTGLMRPSSDSSPMLMASSR